MNPDFFALLGQPRLPSLDLDALKTKFLALSSASHPDRVHGAGDAEKTAATAAFAQLTVAYNNLREPQTRWLHLLELETRRRPDDVQQTPASEMDLFFEIARAAQETDAFLARKAASSSPLARAQLFAHGLEKMERVDQLLAQIQLRREALLAESDAMNAAWNAAPPPGSPARAAALPLDRLQQMYRLAGFLKRWSEQLLERRARLALD